ncbi:hypothetical protein [Blastococcus sp. TF02A-30]|uniref:hypothetical protein n=1 Tax=Blastococcus sp. TF02A-30 TaxID=2250580 RepID=UPI000DE9C6EE|nr:hypothetical protein [Blastococcus sp. TF02A-30]RBY87862.1 hypothetical protein DQ241_11470 [Blastococcus sp. TF02A-30]
MRLSRLFAGSSALVLLGGAAACGLGSVEPKIQLRDAFRALGEETSLAVRLSVPSSADDVRAFAEAADDSGEMPDDDLETLLSSSIVFGYDEGADADDPEDDAVRTALEMGDATPVELRAVGQVAYARADVDAFVEQVPSAASDVEDLQAGLDGAAGTVPEPLLAAAQALLDGDWVSLDAQALLEQAEAQGETVPGAEPLDEELAAQAQELMGTAVEESVVSVQREGEDDDLGDHLVVELDLRKGYGAVRDDLPSLFPGAEGEALADQLPPVKDLPDLDVEVSVWVRDGELTRAEIDAAQFLDEPAGHLVLRADVLDGEPITAPEGALPVDATALLESAASLQAAEGAVDAYTLATWVDMDLAVLAEESGSPSSVAFLPEVLPYYEGIAPDLAITAVGQRVEVTAGGETVCLTPSADGFAEDIVDGPC